MRYKSPLSPRNETERLARYAVDLARTAPELIPALLWLMSVGGRSRRVQAYRRVPPSAEELAALIVYMGDALREILSHKEAAMKQVERVDFAELDLLSVRLQALQRLGLGVESLI